MSARPKNFVDSQKAQHHAELLSNRIRKRFRHLSRKFRKQNIECFRLYDWDIPEVRAVVDWYAGHVVVAEYVRQQTDADWLPHMARAVAETLNLAEANVHIKERRTQTAEGPRYERLDSRNVRFKVKERDLLFWINLDDFLDTGLYSDHRETRLLIREEVPEKRFLNLFAYTGAFTCAAASAGAKSTVTVDRSATYLQWASDNMELNGLQGKQHEFVQSDVPDFLSKVFKEKRRFDIAFIDPPSFFKDYQQKKSFDINREHPSLLKNVIKVMAPDGVIYFSTNHQRFEPKFGSLFVKDLMEVTPKTIPEDYRNKNIHRCWRMIVKSNMTRK